jgi:RND superfamily putative drug exporter
VTGRVITAAASIMILVFLSFLSNGNIIIQQFGVGLAAAIFIDAFVVRTMLVPAVMHLCGRANWWLPEWLGRPLPTLRIGSELDERLTAATVTVEPRAKGGLNIEVVFPPPDGQAR